MELKKMKRDASLHPSTVTNYQMHTRRRRAPSQLNKNSPVRQISLPFNQLDKRLQQVTLKLAGGDKTRIVCLSETDALVVNKSSLRREAVSKRRE